MTEQNEELKKRLEEGFFLQHTNPGSFNMFDESWDVLFLIDACRYDVFEKKNFLSGKLERRISPASCTLEWAKKSFPGHDMSDIVYVSANPFISRLYLEEKEHMELSFSVLEELWESGWNDTLKTVPPERTTEAALRLHAEHPGKKLFIHYMQPHHPFIGEGAIEESGWEASRNKLRNDEKDIPPNVYEMLQQGTVSHEQVLNAYEGNLKLVLTDIEKNMSKFKGKKIISTDHGDCFGEYGVYAHPEGTYIPELIEVPWFEVES